MEANPGRRTLGPLGKKIGRNDVRQSGIARPGSGVSEKVKVQRGTDPKEEALQEVPTNQGVARQSLKGRSGPAGCSRRRLPPRSQERQQLKGDGTWSPRWRNTTRARQLWEDFWASSGSRARAAKSFVRDLAQSVAGEFWAPPLTGEVIVGVAAALKKAKLKSVVSRPKATSEP